VRPAAFPGPTLLDGAMGTALLARGLPAGALPEDWLLDRPDEVAAVHAGHAAAGARVLLTCTFNAAAPRLGPRLGPRVEALCARAVELARGASGEARVAGDLGPSGRFPPGGPAPDPSPVAAGYARAARALAAAGADLLWLESQWEPAEVRLALAAARAAGLPAVVTFTLRQEGDRLVALGGAAAEACLESALAEGAAAAGLNCIPAGPGLAAIARWAHRRLGAPLVAKPSPGLPGAVLSPEAFAEALRPALDAGLEVVGGCCGAGPEHLRAVAAALARRT